MSVNVGAVLDTINVYLQYETFNAGENYFHGFSTVFLAATVKVYNHQCVPVHVSPLPSPLVFNQYVNSPTNFLDFTVFLSSFTNTDGLCPSTTLLVDNYFDSAI